MKTMLSIEGEGIVNIAIVVPVKDVAIVVEVNKMI